MDSARAAAFTTRGREMCGRFSLGFGQPPVETEVAVRSQTAKKIHHKIHKIT
jgi:hypothetical protein